MNPLGTLKIDDYPDTDFAGLYGYLKITDPACVKSSMGFLITMSDFPIVWVLKLQTKTALSMMEAEIVALVHCCRELFPMCDIVKEVGKVVGLASDDLSLMHVSVHGYWPRQFHQSSHLEASTKPSRQFGFEKRYRSEVSN